VVERLLHNWHGYVKLRLHGYSPERFLNLCNARKLEIWGILCKDGDYEFFMTVPGYRKVKPLVRKSRVRLRILERYGLPFFLYRNRKRKLFGAGLAGFFVFLYVMSLFVWDIEFEGNYHYTYDTLIRYLADQDVDYGMYKKRIDCEELESGFRAHFPEITWVSARVSGTRLLIHIKENEVISTLPEKDETPCDLVAAKPGVITSMIVRQGIAQVAIGDEVEAGQVLVKGIVPIVNDAEEVVNQYTVRADADVTARTVNGYSKSFPLMHTERVATGRTRRGWYLKAGKASFTFLVPAWGEQQWDYVMEERQLKLFSNFYLPFYLGDIKGKEMSAYDRKYTEEELKDIAGREKELFAEKLTEKGVQILENNDRIETSATKCTITGQFVTLEQIQKAAPLAQEEIIPNIEPEETKATQ